jgi:hypothetical protein
MKDVSMERRMLVVSGQWILVLGVPGVPGVLGVLGVPGVLGVRSTWS